MAGCGGGTCGIERERERERARVLEAVARACPEFDWGSLQVEGVLADGVDGVEARRLAAAIEEILPVRARFCPAGPEGLGDWIYLLAGLHTPSLLELREEEGRADGGDARASETYLRVGLSPLGRFATLQEVEFRLERDGDALFVHEDRRLGVEDTRLRTMVKALQGALRKRRIVMLDFAFLAREPSTARQPEYERRYGTAPVLFNFLFDPSPPTTRVTTWLGAAA